MASSIRWYLKEFVRGEWLTKFFTVKTAPLITPPYFRGFPTLTHNECTHCLACMMVCPAPDAIEVLKTDGVWNPVIYPGHCIRCGLCVEACPEDVLSSGVILETQKAEHTSFSATFHITINPAVCKRCGNCAVVCPVNKEIDLSLGWAGTASSDEVIMRIIDGDMRVIHNEKCTGCKTCEKGCPNHAIRVARVVEGVQEADG